MGGGVGTIALTQGTIAAVGNVAMQKIVDKRDSISLSQTTVAGVFGTIGGVIGQKIGGFSGIAVSVISGTTEYGFDSYINLMYDPNFNPDECPMKRE